MSAQDDLRYAASLLASCIGDSTGSRLYWNLIETGLADSAGFWLDGADQAGSFGGYVSTAPENLKKVVDIYKQTLLEVQEQGLGEDEWRRAQHKFATSLTLRGETPFGRLMSLGGNYIYHNRYFAVQDVVDAIFAATLEQAQGVLAKHPFDQLYTYTLGPNIS